MEHTSLGKTEFEEPDLPTGRCRKEEEFYAGHTVRASDDAVENRDGSLDGGILEDGSAIVTGRESGEWIKYREEDVLEY